MIKVGVDIVKIDRIEDMIEKYGRRFLEKNFTSAEIDYCNSKAYPCQHFAGKFAAKEAVKKALLSLNPTLMVLMRNVEVKNGIDGIPYIELHGALKEICKDYCIEVSIAHEKNWYAVAMAMVAI